MKSILRWIQEWSGVWTGTGETQDGNAVLVRSSFFPLMEAAGTGVQIEMLDPATAQLLHGVRAIIAVGPDNQLQTTGYSTLVGMMTLQQTPDDEGVLALSGVSVQGTMVNVTYLQESSDLMQFSAFWRPASAKLTAAEGEAMTCRMRRVQPWKPGAR